MEVSILGKKTIFLKTIISFHLCSEFFPNAELGAIVWLLVVCH